AVDVDEGDARMARAQLVGTHVVQLSGAEQAEVTALARDGRQHVHHAVAVGRPSRPRVDRLAIALANAVERIGAHGLEASGADMPKRKETRNGIERTLR